MTIARPSFLPQVRLTLGKRSFWQALGSLKLAVVLLVVLAAVLAWASTLEARQGREVAGWYVYSSSWFLGLLGLLGLNIFSAAAVRYPWKRHQVGFVVTHAGLLVLLVGAWQSFVGGVEGRVSLVEGEATDQVTVPLVSQITAVWVGQPHEAPYRFSFSAGPRDWPAGRVVDCGTVDGVHARLLAHYRYARPVEEWIADASQQGVPVINFKVTGKDGGLVAEQWLADQQYGDALLVGPIRLQLERAPSQQALNEFLRPDEQPSGEQGRLTMYLADVVKSVDVAEVIGQTIPLTDQVGVQIVEYVPHAQSDNMGVFTSKGDLPKNPMLELRVQVAGEPQPRRQIAFAKDPLLNLDGVYQKPCPVRFRYSHPAIKRPTAIELLQTSDGKLWGRTCIGGKYTSLGEVSAATRVMLPGGFQVEFPRHLPHARRKVTFVPLELAQAQGKEKPEPATLVELTVAGTSQAIWLQRNSPGYSRAAIHTSAGTLSLNYGFGQHPLGAALELIQFQQLKNPGDQGNAGFSSAVRVADLERKSNEQHVISMNRPLKVGKFTLYQSSFDEAGHGKKISSFTASYDPGRGLKYAGSLMIALGIGIMFYMRAYFFKSKSRGHSAPRATRDGAGPGESSFQSSLPQTSGRSAA